MACEKVVKDTWLVHEQAHLRQPLFSCAFITFSLSKDMNVFTESLRLSKARYPIRFISFFACEKAIEGVCRSLSSIYFTPRSMISGSPGIMRIASFTSRNAKGSCMIVFVMLNIEWALAIWRTGSVDV